MTRLLRWVSGWRPSRGRAGQPLPSALDLVKTGRVYYALNLTSRTGHVDLNTGLGTFSLSNGALGAAGPMCILSFNGDVGRSPEKPFGVLGSIVSVELRFYLTELTDEVIE